MYYCNKCGEKIKKHDDFCEKCGNQITSENVTKENALSEQVKNVKSINKKDLVRIVVVIVSVVLVIALYRYLDKSFFTPERVTKKYLEAVVNNEADKAYNYLYEDSLTKYLSENYFKTYLTYLKENKLVNNTEIVNIDINGDGVKRICTAQIGETEIQFSLIQQDKALLFFDDWKVDPKSLTKRCYFEVPKGTNLYLDDIEILTLKSTMEAEEEQEAEENESDNLEEEITEEYDRSKTLAVNLFEGGIYNIILKYEDESKKLEYYTGQNKETTIIEMEISYKTFHKETDALAIKFAKLIFSTEKEVKKSEYANFVSMDSEFMKNYEQYESIRQDQVQVNKKEYKDIDFDKLGISYDLAQPAYVQGSILTNSTSHVKEITYIQNTDGWIINDVELEYNASYQYIPDNTAWEDVEEGDYDSNSNLEKLTAEETEKIETLFENYENDFIKAINAKDYSIIEEYIEDGSDLYKQHQELFSSNQEIKEKLIEYTIRSIDHTDENAENAYKVIVTEKITMEVDGELYENKEYDWIYYVSEEFLLTDLAEPM